MGRAGASSADADAWAERCGELAGWAMARLVNRTDRYGAYTGRGGKTAPLTCPPHGPEPDALDLPRLARHFAARRTEDVVGCHSLAADSTGKTCDIDVDAHPGTEADPAANWEFARYLYDWLAGLGFSPLLYESNGKGGYHVRLLFARPVPGHVLHNLGRWLTADHAEAGLKDRPESYPKQAELTPTKRWGGWLRLPGRHHTRDFWCRVWDGGQWLAGAEAVGHVLSLTGDDPDKIPHEAAVYGAERVDPAPRPVVSVCRRGTAAPGPWDTAEKPWDWFNARTTWDDLLGSHNWVRVRDRGDGAVEWRRPGKDDAGISATTGYCKADGKELLYVFSTNGGPLPAGKAMDLFAAFVLLDHGGDYRRAVAAVRGMGFGAPPPRPAADRSGWLNIGEG